MTTRGDERYPQPAPSAETTMANPPQPLSPDCASLEVDLFEAVPGGRELALLRLEGRYRSRLARPLLEATLLVDDGLAIHRHEPLPHSTALEPGVGDDDWLWRAAFAISLAALEDPETAYVLSAGAGLSIELGDPAHWQAAVPPRARRRGARADRLRRQERLGRQGQGRLQRPVERRKRSPAQGPQPRPHQRPEASAAAAPDPPASPPPRDRRRHGAPPSPQWDADDLQPDLLQRA